MMKRTDIIKFAKLLNPENAIAVEVGVRKADFSFQIASLYKGAYVYMVDPYKYFPRTVYRELGNHRQAKQEKILSIAKNKMYPFWERTSFIRETSKEALRHFKENSLDFVYIDANHSFEYITFDINEWYNKVKSGGILAGHDYYNSGIINICDVKDAVDIFVAEHKLNLLVTDEIIKSWMIIKPNA